MTLPAAVESLFARSRFLAPFAVYAAFAALVYVAHGPEPELSIDHVSYFKLADEILAAFPGGNYWRSFNSVRGYGVLLAYLHGITGSHVASLKVLLAVMTVAYLAAFQLFIGLATRSRAQAVLFSLLSALFVSLGATFWGVTDFTASLNRTLIVPFVLVLAWSFFACRDSGWRYALFPTLVGLSLMHLSAFHYFLVFAVYEALDFAIRRRFRPDRRIAQFALALAASVAVQAGIEGYGSGAAGYFQQVAKMALPASKEALPSRAPSTAPEEMRLPPPSVDRLTPQEAWRLELLAFPWRNFPPPIATVATIASSYSVIFLLAALGAWRIYLMGEANDLDRSMAVLAVAIPIAAYGLQASLWILRSRTQILPFTIEEVRALNMIMVPSVWFAYRLWERVPATVGAHGPWLRAAIVAAFVLQPIVVVRAIPVSWREALVDQLLERGIVKRSDALRMLYARQFLGLGESGCRFYYASRGVIDWLARNTAPDERVLTNLNEFHLFRHNSIGPYLGVVSLQVWDPQRARWAESTETIDRILATRDIEQVKSLGRSLGADYAVVNWSAEPAAYRDSCYSVVRVQ